MRVLGLVVSCAGGGVDERVRSLVGNVSRLDSSERLFLGKAQAGSTSAGRL